MEEKLGYAVVKDEQESISNCVEGRDVFINLPTGFGKSLCYYCLPFDILNNYTSQYSVVTSATVRDTTFLTGVSSSSLIRLCLMVYQSQIHMKRFDGGVTLLVTTTL